MEIAITDELGDAGRKPIVVAAPIEDRDLVSARQCVADLKRAGEPGAAEDEEVQRLGGARSRYAAAHAKGERAAGECGVTQEFATIGHDHLP